MLEAAVRDRPDDLPARESLGYALEILDRPEEALRAFEEVLRIEPGRELTLPSSARVLARLQRPDLARLALQKTIAVNPWRSEYRLALAEVCCQAGDWPGAVAACREAIRLNPELFEARSLLDPVLPVVQPAREGRRRVPDPAPFLPRQPRGLAAVVRAAEAGAARGRWLLRDWQALNWVARPQPQSNARAQPRGRGDERRPIARARAGRGRD